MRSSHFLLALLAALILSGCSERPGGSAGRPIEIRFAHAHAPDTNAELHFTAAVFAETVKEMSDRLEIKVYPQATLGSEREIYEGLQFGRSGAALTVSGSAILNNFDQRVGVLDLPYLWKDYDHVHRVLDGEVGRELAADLEKQGLVVLAWLDSWGWRHVVTTQKPVRRPEDLRGLKIRTIPTPMYLATLSMMGANPTPMTYGEIYTGLQTGVIDGFEQASAIIVAERFYEVTRHMALTRHLFGPLVICYSKAQWDKLSAEDQATLREAAIRTRDRQRARGPEREAEAMQFLRAQGMNVYEMDVSGFEQAAIQVQDRLAAERGATDLLRKIRAAAAAP